MHALFIRSLLEIISKAMESLVNMEFYASYVYLSMASYYNHDDQALHGFANYFQKASDEERVHGMKLMEYQAKRGGRVVFQDIARPSTMEWGTPVEAMEA